MSTDRPATSPMYGLGDQTVRDATTYDEARRRHTWRVPARYNIAWDTCDRHADGAGRRALVWEAPGRAGETYSFDDLRRLSDRLAAALQALGVERGARVALMLPQTPEHLVTHLAVFKLGAVSVPLSRLFGPEALRYRLGDSGATVLVTDAENVAKAIEVWPALPALRHVVLAGREPGPPGDARVHAFADVLARGSDGFRAVDTAADDPALLIYTSGTTGPPKGALHAHRYLLGYNGVDYANNFFAPGDVYWSPADWAWVGGLLVGLFCPLAHGVPVVATTARFDPVGAFELMERHGVTNSLLSATALRQIAVRVDEPRRYRLRLRALFSGGERVTPEIWRWTDERLGLRINEVYGQTEANILIGENDPLIPPRPEPLGRPYPGHDVAIVDDQGRVVGPGELGVIALRRGDPVLMLGYWNRPDATAAAWRGEWFLTGDLGTVDAGGAVHYKGRADDVINSAGFRIGPAEVEGCLLEHAAAEQCAVIGVPDTVRGEAVKAFVKLAPGHTASPALAEALMQHVKTRLGAFQRPREIEWIEELPMTVSGKIRRAELRERARHRLPARAAPETLPDFPLNPQPPRAEEVDVTGPVRVLVVDDDPAVLDVLCEVVESIGSEPVRADGGAAALEMLERQPCAVVLTDLRMPGLNGLDLLQAVRKVSPFVQVVILTGYAEVGSAVEAVRRGALDYLTKPLGVDELQQVLRRTIARYHQLIEREALLAELRQTNEALRVALARAAANERLAALGEIAVGLHHAILNPLAGILGALHVIGDETGDRDVKHEALVAAVSEVRRIESIVHGLRSLDAVPVTPYVGNTAMVDVARIVAGGGEPDVARRHGPPA